ncbi:MerR HTH family regulatory protein [Rathayibacter oskolensis]|uniref:MerR HTH family regulatory protein n=1 Tax=Rathayibacter oskolensis TaxID=1891671 RepID=A0A1X7P078_9MICO|nr:chaperone modulator CbpM [Rathayibacter oskolensis]SMH43942.1 MerR HTH family regulatory protein [Rathayibacter oskolensis]
MTSPLLPMLPLRLDLERVAAASGTHPELIVRFVELGLVPARRDAGGRLWFEPAAPALVRRILRLHADLSLNYAAVALVIDLLARIDVLENRRRVIHSGEATPPWT